METSQREYLIIGLPELDKTKFGAVKNIPNKNKPSGGLWACQYTPDNPDGYVSAWHEYIAKYATGFLFDVTSKDNTADCVMFKLKETARVYNIDSLEDLEKLLQEVGFNENPDYPEEKYLDYESFSKQYDAIELTEEGVIATMHAPYGLNGWDVQTLFLCNMDCIEESKHLQLELKGSRYELCDEIEKLSDSDYIKQTVEKYESLQFLPHRSSFTKDSQSRVDYFYHYIDTILDAVVYRKESSDETQYGYLLGKNLFSEELNETVIAEALCDPKTKAEIEKRKNYIGEFSVDSEGKGHLKQNPEHKERIEKLWERITPPCNKSKPNITKMISEPGHGGLD